MLLWWANYGMSFVNSKYDLYSNIISHYNDVIMGMMASQITSLTIVFSTVYLDTNQRKHQSSASLAFVRGIHRRLVNSPHKWPVTRKMFPFDDVIMWYTAYSVTLWCCSIPNIHRLAYIVIMVADALGPVLQQGSDAVVSLSANGSAAFKESCTLIG